jgi:DNA modification methylase
MATLPAGSVHTCISSPPYWGLRDYGAEGQIGLEETPEAYVARMVEVYRAVWRVLRDDGTCWVNLGDSYAGSWGAQSRGASDAETCLSARQWQAHPKRSGTGSLKRTPGIKGKDLVGIPWMVAFALRADGWYLRSDIVWSKPNPMPESVTDRPTKAHEYVFLLTKAPRYYYDADSIREPNLPQSVQRASYSGRGHPRGWHTEAVPISGGKQDELADLNPLGRNRRTVWTIATQPYAEAHFATYPEKLVEPMVLAGTSERGCCPECGAPWRRLVSKTTNGMDIINAHERVSDTTEARGGKAKCPSGLQVAARTVGWEPGCEHGRQPVPCTVLDPFAGSGTTGVVACGHGRNFVGTELNPEYAAMARRRIGAVNPLLVREACA